MPSTAAEAPGPVVLKLGGSLVTRKKEVEKLRPKVIARLAAELATVSDVPVVLLHGAGSFGHPGAKRFGLANPPQRNDRRSERTRGAAIVATEVRRLHLAILRELVAAGLRPLSVPMATHARNRGGTLASIDASPIEDALERGAMPVTFGDVVPDDDWGFSILSADTIAEALVPLLRPARVVFATDVPGILEKDRGARRAIIEEVTDDVVSSLPSTGAGQDVTGGIRGKATAMRRIARAGVDAVLISGLTDGAVARAIRGESVYGSWARARPG
jgi:isopentenyl phosphate kinase